MYQSPNIVTNHVFLVETLGLLLCAYSHILFKFINMNNKDLDIQEYPVANLTVILHQ